MSTAAADNWWRGPRSSGEFETRSETTWPCLSPGKRRPGRRKGRSAVGSPGIGNDIDIIERICRDQARSVDRSNVLDNEGYPKLGQGRLSKRKLAQSQNPLPGCSEEIDVKKLSLETRESNCNDEDKTDRKISKRYRRSDLICIDIEKVLERQRSLSESQTSSSGKPRIKLNLNLSIRNPLDSSARAIECRKGKHREVPRAKRISKLKRVIFREREYKKQTNILKRELFDLDKIEAMTKDVNEIDFNKLKISGEPKPEVRIARSLSTLNLFDNKYRNKKIDDLVDDQMLETNKNDVVAKLANLLIKRDGDISSEINFNHDHNENYSEDFEDSNILTKTLGLKICDETGETVEVEFPKDLEIDSGQKTNENYPKHSRNFREYCTNDLTQGLNKSSEIFLAEIYRLQRRMYERDEVRGRCRRRFYAGFKEVLKHVESKKIKFVFIAPDLEGIDGCRGGLDEFVSKLISVCKMREVVFCFSLNKRKLGYYTHKKGSVSCVGIANYSGLEEKFKNVLTELMISRNSYRRLNHVEETDDAILNETLLSSRINLLLKSLTVTPCS